MLDAVKITETVSYSQPVVSPHHNNVARYHQHITIESATAKCFQVSDNVDRLLAEITDLHCVIVY